MIGGNEAARRLHWAVGMVLAPSYPPRPPRPLPYVDQTSVNIDELSGSTTVNSSSVAPVPSAGKPRTCWTTWTAAVECMELADGRLCTHHRRRRALHQGHASCFSLLCLLSESLQCLANPVGPCLVHTPPCPCSKISANKCRVPRRYLNPYRNQHQKASNAQICLVADSIPPSHAQSTNDSTQPRGLLTLVLVQSFGYKVGCPSPRRLGTRRISFAFAHSRRSRRTMVISRRQLPPHRAQLHCSFHPQMQLSHTCRPTAGYKKESAGRLGLATSASSVFPEPITSATIS
jgi:hypothetical protein